MAKMSRIIFTTIILMTMAVVAEAQVNSVVFGRNRVQHRIFKWQYYQTKNFNVYFYDGGQELAKYVLQEAEKQLPEMETASEYSLQRRANIVLYNNFTDFKQTNIGGDADPLGNGNTTQLVNNKMVVYFNANHADLKRQIRQGIGDIITKNVLFGDDLGEVAGNQALLVLPQWLTDGYVAYLGENWSTALDDEFKSEILSGNFSKFSSLARYKPTLTGHAFWFFIEEKYKKENVTYFLYLARIYKNINRASTQITKLKFNALLREFMEYQENKYSEDVRKRKTYVKGNYVDGFIVNKRTDYFNFSVNPNKRDNSYVVTEYKRGQVRVILDDAFEKKTLLKYGVRNYLGKIDHNLPYTAWDVKGTRIAVAYAEEGKLKLFVYDVLNRFKSTKLVLDTTFQQIQDMKFMLDSKTMLISAVRNGHTDLYSYDIGKEKLRPITNDVYDDLDASFVAFPGKTGIIFSSNRPSPNAPKGDTILPPDNRYNVFLITDYGDKPELNQITQLTDLKYGDARFPTQYNANHFTFVSDENGIGNRYAGFFNSTKEGLDTLVLIGGEVLRNPSAEQVDSTLKVFKQTDIDSIAVVSISSDSTYTFPLSNYPSSIVESKIAGENNQVSEVTRQSDDKSLYKLKIDENTLRRRNITALPTTYSKKLRRESRFTDVSKANPGEVKTKPKKDVEDFFQSEFDDKDSIPQPTEENDIQITTGQEENVLATAKLYTYKPKKFSLNFGGVSLYNAVLINRYEPYNGGGGPIRLNGNSPLNGLVKVGVSDLMEDIHLTGAFRLGSGLQDNEWFINYQNLRRRVDWGGSYYRNMQEFGFNGSNLTARQFTNLYQANVSYPLNEVRRIALKTGYRRDKNVFLSPFGLEIPNEAEQYSVSSIEFVHDNTLNPENNIWEGFRGKVFFDYNAQIGKKKTDLGRNTFNVGFDVRNYYPIYRNMIWAVRAGGDFSFGNQKLVYFLGGTDGWFIFNNNIKNDGTYRYFNEANIPAADQEYAFQSLAVNMRGYIQNLASGNNALVVNSEVRMPVMSTLFDKTANNKFLRDLQLTQFVDFGTAWNGGIENIMRPVQTFASGGSATVKLKAGGLGPFAGGYGFGARSTLLGYFIKYDVAWPMNVLFKGKPQMYLSLGLDF